MSPEVYSHLCAISQVHRTIVEVRGVAIGYMPIAEKFAKLLDGEGFIPHVDHVAGYGDCWVWMIWDNLQIISKVW